MYPYSAIGLFESRFSFSPTVIWIEALLKKQYSNYLTSFRIYFLQGRAGAWDLLLHILLPQVWPEQGP